MSIFRRIADIFKANVNDVLDRAEDPEKMLKQMVLEMEESVNKATLAVAQAIANEKSLERKIAKAQEQSRDWQQKAVQALQAGREDLARAALEKKAVADRNVADLQPIYEQAKATTAKLRQQLDQLKAKLDEARARQSTLIARSQAAKAQKQIAQAFSGVGSDAFAKFDKFEGKIEQLEAEASAFEQLAGESTSLEQEFKMLGSSAAVEEELAKLKAALGQLPPGVQEQK
ncbi:MAG: PspA/IM30 family protein [Bacteroidota bacterium]|nr:PspA/IM30 family protein [Candidatus Kapabacteria bacterium]MCS7302618.1 PspA/IM30 family protein [Candidatus Kapabacteria bacterium]MCX7936448.1 PspA/IM30 family protein [Chlorobiota bacterium]MDW8074272.1 PspA/IM30 family protein [Bacteroidota bacterium]MDW8271252.1 PspA/IM30 family protein [Bacteroidota bacterium]